VKKIALPLAVVAALSSTLTACGSSSSSEKTLTVFAAASLKGTFTQLKAEFESSHPGVKVVLDFDGSATLVQQIQAGAPADVFASADTKNMAKLGATAESPTDFATNVLEIATPVGNPAHVARLADLSRSGLTLVVCAAPVPCGAATQQLAAANNLTLNPVSEEQSVTGVLAKVESGQADAGIVYVTDVRSAAGQVTGVEIPAARNVSTTYEIAALKGATESALAQDWVALVSGAAGQQVLRAAGFGKA
jgi:molybdate transport system substrate-binding protein